MKHLRVLFIEDDADQRRSLAKDLRSKGFKVTAARSGKTGLSYFKKRTFDIILCDLHMEELDGLDVLDRVRELDPDIPFIITTAHGAVSQAVKAIKRGAHHFILKPLEVNEIVLTIRQTIEQAELKRKLNESQAALRMVMENVPDVIFSLNTSGEFLNISPAAESVLGYKPSEYLGTSVFKLIHPEDLPLAQSSMAESIRTGKPKVKLLQFRMVASDGEVKHFEVSRKLVFTNGRVARIDGIARDITERLDLRSRLADYSSDLEKKVAELEKRSQELAEAKDELQAILDSSPHEAILLVDTSDIVKSANSAVTRFFGLQQNEVIGNTFDEFVEKAKHVFQDPSSFLLQIERLKATPGVTDCCAEDFSLTEIFNRGVQLSGPGSITLSPISSCVFDHECKERGRVWLFMDITHLKVADEQIHTIVKASPIPTIVSRIEDGRILYINDKLAELIGYSVNELIGRSTPDFYYDSEDRKTVLERLKSDGYLKDFETRIKKADGSVIWMLFSLVVTQMAGEQVILGGLYDITQRKEAEEELTRERNFVSAVLDTAGALVVVLDPEGRIVRFNRACEETTGYSSEEVRNRFFWDLFLIPEEVDMVKSVFGRLCCGQYPAMVENYWLTKEGDRRLISWANTILQNESGGVEYVIGTGIDVTEHRKADEKMKLYRELFMNASDGMVITDVDGHFIERNPAHIKATGMKDEELDGVSMLDLLSIYGDEIVDKLKSTGEYRGEILAPHSDGTHHSLDLSVFPIRSKSGEILRFVGIARDISERKEFEEALRVSEERFRSLVENAKDVIYSMTPSGEFSYLSPQFSETLGYDTSEFLGKSVVSLLHPDDKEEAIQWLEAEIKEEGTGGGGYEFRMLHKDGSTRWFIENGSIIYDEDGKILEIIGIVHDITELKRAMHDLEEANRHLKETQFQLVQSEKMASLGTLVAGIAHEINTPIGAVSSMHDTLFRTLEKLKEMIKTRFSGEGEDAAKFAMIMKVIDDSNKVIRPGTERVINIVRKLRSFARLDEAELKKVDIHEGLEDTLTLIHHELKHDITINREYGNVPAISCFPGQLNQVFLNIIINAKQAIKGKGEITIATFTKSEKVYVSIKDTGVGISKENVKKVFDPGFTTKGVGVGTGLGLSICYQIIQDHRGEIKVESEMGKGTTFTIILPSDLDKLLEA